MYFQHLENQRNILPRIMVTRVEYGQSMGSSKHHFAAFQTARSAVIELISADPIGRIIRSYRAIKPIYLIKTVHCAHPNIAILIGFYR